MAKSSKIEDYWRQNNIEGLLKEITHNLAQKMPSDPALAIFQHLQKKFPRSFKSLIDESPNMDMNPKPRTSTMQSQSIFSPRSEAGRDTGNSSDMERRGSNQSQISGMGTIRPTAGSAFTDLLKQNSNTISSAPDLNMRNLARAGRISQKTVRLGKDIQSDRDILEEEFIKPSNATANAPPTTHTSDSSLHVHPQQGHTHEEPTTKQLIKYKQHIHLENVRRTHRERLAALAKTEREKEKFLQPDQQIKSDEIHQQKSSDDPTVSHVRSETSSTKSAHKPIVKSKEEEDILNDENIFQPARRKLREKHRTRLTGSRSNSPTGRREFMRNLATTMKGGHRNFAPMTQFGICKVCGNMMNNEGDHSKQYSQQVSAAPTVRSYQQQASGQSETSEGENVDDWFDSASEVSGSRDMVPWKSDEITPRPSDKNPFQKMFFQPIDDNRSSQRRPPIPTAILTDDEAKSKRLTTPRMSSSDIFIRTPEPPSRHSPSARSIPSPVVKKPSTNTLAVTDRQSPKTTTNLSSPQSLSTTSRRMSGVSGREQSPDGSDEN